MLKRLGIHCFVLFEVSTCEYSRATFPPVGNTKLETIESQNIFKAGGGLLWSEVYLLH